MTSSDREFWNARLAPDLMQQSQGEEMLVVS